MLLILFVLMGSFSLTGCQPEEKITRAARPRLNDMNRLLVAIVQRDDPKGEIKIKTWFFLVAGADSEIDALADPFYQFLKSIRFDSPNDPTWTLPQGWTEKKEKDPKMPAATISTGADVKSLSLTVWSRKFANVTDNVNNWRRQLGLMGLDLLDLDGFMRPEKVAGRPALVVDTTGPASIARLQPLTDPPPPPFRFQTPPEWEEIPPTNQKFYVLSFVARDGARKADINVSVLPGDGGGLAPNVNRWRGQIKLADLVPAQIDALPDVAIGNAKGKLVDFTGPEPPPEPEPPLEDGKKLWKQQPDRILGAVIFRTDNSLFFKMTGPADLVGRQQPAFETFLKSIKFDG